MVSMGRTSSPLPTARRRSTSSTLSPSVRLATCSRGVVRHSSSSRSVCSTREMNTLRPLTMYLVPLRSARVVMLVVSEPASGSVTPKACRRRLPLAISGR